MVWPKGRKRPEIRGDNNPAKRPEVREKLSKAKTGKHTGGIVDDRTHKRLHRYSSKF
jgi:hypothetical protein